MHAGDSGNMQEWRLELLVSEPAAFAQIVEALNSHGVAFSAGRRTGSGLRFVLYGLRFGVLDGE